MREIIFDTETTGLSPTEGHRMIEIGMIEMVNRLPTGNTFHHYINPLREISAESTRITGITDDHVKDAPPFPDLIEDMLAFIKDAPLVAHNANFDMSFLNYELEQAGHNFLRNEVIDTLAIAKKAFPGARHSLDALCKRFNITAHENRTLHGALLDAQLLAEVYIELTGGLQESLILEETTNTETTTIATATLNRTPLIIQPTEAEAQNAAAWQAKSLPNLNKKSENSAKTFSRNTFETMPAVIPDGMFSQNL